jgi:hypothetical protein
MNVTPSPKFASGAVLMQALKTLLSGDRSAVAHKADVARSKYRTV